MTSNNPQKNPNRTTSSTGLGMEKYSLFDPTIDGHSIDIPKAMPLKINDISPPKQKRTEKFALRMLQPIPASSPDKEKFQIPSEIQKSIRKNFSKLCQENGFMLNPSIADQIENIFYSFIFQLISESFSNACRRVGKNIDSSKRAVTYSPYLNIFSLATEYNFLTTLRQAQYATNPFLSQHIRSNFSPVTPLLSDQRSIEYLQYQKTLLKCMNNIISLRIDREQESKQGSDFKAQRDKRKSDIEDNKKTYISHSPEHLMILKRTQQFEEGKRKIIIKPKDILFAFKSLPYDYGISYPDLLLQLNSEKA